MGHVCSKSWQTLWNVLVTACVCLRVFFYVHHIFLFKKITEKLELQICIKFYFKPYKSCVETIEVMKTAFGDECMGNAQIKEWYKRFKDSSTSAD